MYWNFVPLIGYAGVVDPKQGLGSAVHKIV